MQDFMVHGSGVEDVRVQANPNSGRPTLITKPVFRLATTQAAQGNLAMSGSGLSLSGSGGATPDPEP